MPAHKALEHIVTRGKDVAHIVKNGEAEALSEIRQADSGKAEFLTVDEQRRATDGKAGIGIAGSSLI